jgi:hypothetical protein
MGPTGWHWGKTVYTRQGVTDATVGLNHFLGGVSIDLTV